MRRTHIKKHDSEKTLCGLSDVMIDDFGGFEKWVEGWSKDRIIQWSKTQGYCAHCIKKVLKMKEVF